MAHWARRAAGRPHRAQYHPYRRARARPDRGGLWRDRRGRVAGLGRRNHRRKGVSTCPARSRRSASRSRRSAFDDAVEPQGQGRQAHHAQARADHGGVGRQAHARGGQSCAERAAIAALRRQTVAAGEPGLLASLPKYCDAYRARSEDRHALRAAALVDRAGAVGRGADACRRGAARHQRADVGADLLAAHSRSQRRGRAARVAQYRVAGRRQRRLAARRAATMIPRRRKARGRTRELRLYSQNWMPAAKAHRMLTRLLGDPDLAAKDLTAAVADKRLPCMQRVIASHIAPDQDRKIVPLSFWDEYAFGFDPVSGKLQIGPKGLAVEFRSGAAFFVCKPKFEKIWPKLAASVVRTDDKLARRMPGPQPKLRWRTALARELIRRARAGEPEPTAEQMCALVQDKSGGPDVRTVQKEMKKLLS